MPATYSQQNRQLQVTTPLGEDALLLIGFEGAEQFNKLFTYKLRMLSTNSSIAAKDIVGKNVTFSVTLRDKTPRYFNGYVSRFVYKGQDDRFSLYLAEVVPWTWFLTQTKDCRIFQAKTVPQIIKEVFRDFSIAKVDDSAITSTHEPWEYCVQYRESDFDFVSRLMEQEGIYSYFKHENGVHTLILGDSARGYKIADEKSATLKASFSSGASSDNLLDWERVYEFRPAKYAHADYNFETPSANMVAQAAGTSKVPGTDQFEVFEYPGDYETKSQGEADARIRMEEIAAGTDVVHGRSVNASWSPGFKFTVDQHHVADEEGNIYVLCSTAHEAKLTGEYTSTDTAELSYSNTFTAISAAKPFRPERMTPRPFVRGPQTAVVVGPPGEQIPVDKLGRVKVSFFWDRRSKKDDTSSCWIRVSQISGGAGWGTVHHPHTGHEVIVSFIEGDPDRPIITGRVYNGENGTALDAVGKKSQMTIHDHGGNSMIMEGEGSNQRIKMFTPHQNTTLQIGSPNADSNGFGMFTDGFTTLVTGQDHSSLVGGDKKSGVDGNQTTEVNQNNTQIIHGSDTQICYGTSSSTVYGVHWDKHVGGHMEFHLGMHLDNHLGVHLDHHFVGHEELHVGAHSNVNLSVDFNLDATRSFEKSLDKKWLKNLFTSKIVKEQLLANERACKVMDEYMEAERFREKITGIMEQKINELHQEINEMSAKIKNTCGIKAGLILFESTSGDATIKSSGDTVLNATGRIQIRGSNVTIKDGDIAIS